MFRLWKYPEDLITHTQINAMLRASDLKTVSNDNIELKHLGKKGLHLDNSGTKIIASNIIKSVRSS